MRRAQIGNSISGAGMRMGYAVGPTPDRRPGDSAGPAVLIGHPPVVLLHQEMSGWMLRVQDVLDRISLVFVFVLWVVVPVCGILGLLFR